MGWFGLGIESHGVEVVVTNKHERAWMWTRERVSFDYLLDNCQLPIFSISLSLSFSIFFFLFRNTLVSSLTSTHWTRYQWMIQLLRGWINSCRDRKRELILDHLLFTLFYPLWQIGTPYIHVPIMFFVFSINTPFVSPLPCRFFLLGGCDVMWCMPLHQCPYACLGACKRGEKKKKKKTRKKRKKGKRKGEKDPLLPPNTFYPLGLHAWQEGKIPVPFPSLDRSLYSLVQKVSLALLFSWFGSTSRKEKKERKKRRGKGWW